MNGIDLDFVFRYHPPRPDQTPRYEALRDGARTFARLIDGLVPDGADKMAAFRKLRECVMTANAGIAMDGSLVQAYPPEGHTDPEPASATLSVEFEVNGSVFHAAAATVTYQQIITCAASIPGAMSRLEDPELDVTFLSGDGKVTGLLHRSQQIALEGAGRWRFTVAGMSIPPADPVP